MPTDQVTQLHPPIEHFSSCDRDVYGRAVMHLMAAGRAGEITADAVRLEVRKYRDTGPCDCLKLRLWSVEEQLRAARKAWRASTTDGNAQRVTALTARRDLLRGMA